MSEECMTNEVRAVFERVQRHELRIVPYRTSRSQKVSSAGAPGDDRPKVSLIGTDLSLNETGRVYLLAKMLEPGFRVEIVGLTDCHSSHPVWAPLDTGEIRYRAVPASYKLPAFLPAARKVLRMLDGDIIYAISLQIPSFGLALLKARGRGTPVVLDNSDWEFPRPEHGLKWHQYRGFRHVRGSFYRAVMERLHVRASAITCSNRLLQQRFGGTLIPHAKDVSLFDPSLYDARQIRSELSLPDKKIVLFAGTPRPHKGVEDLLEATMAMNRDDVLTMVMGGDPGDPFVADLQARYSGPRFRWLGPQPIAELPRFLAVSDVAAVPMRDTAYSRGQMPAKIFDAMAMAKPIVSTEIGDIPHVIDGCGIVVRPGNVDAIRGALERVLDDEGLATRLGTEGRRKCAAEYSKDDVGKRLRGMMHEVLRRKAAARSASGLGPR